MVLFLLPTRKEMMRVLFVVHERAKYDSCRFRLDDESATNMRNHTVSAIESNDISIVALKYLHAK
jgi:hypothetical protein